MKSIGKVIEVTDTELMVHVLAGKDVGKDIKIQLEFVREHRDIYTVTDE